MSAPHSSATEPGPQSSLPRSSMSLSEDISQVLSTGYHPPVFCHTFPQTPPLSPRSPSLFFGSFSLCPYMRRVSYMGHVTPFMLPIFQFSRTFLWLILTGLYFSIHPHLMASYFTKKHYGDLLFPLLTTNWYTQLYPKSGPFYLLSTFHVHLLKFGVKLSLLSPY